MIWLISAILCFLLVLGLLSVFYPEYLHALVPAKKRHRHF